MKYVFSRLYTAFVSILFLSTVTCVYVHPGEPAFVIVPVANVVSAPFEATDTHVLASLYRNLSPVEPKNDHCHTRRYQLLYNELVYVHSIKNGQAQIEIPHILHYHEHNVGIQKFYWMRADQLAPLSKLIAKRAELDAIPPTIIRGQCEPIQTLSRAHTVVLAMPYIDPISKITFSAGTRFVQALGYTQACADTSAVYRLDYHTGRAHIMHIPRSLLLRLASESSIEQKIDCFVGLIKSWANICNGFIPYVWGGASFTHIINAPEGICNEDQAFSTLHVPRQSREAYGTFGHGFDCSCLISRAALACGLPYYLGNSTSITRLAESIHPGSEIHKGDIVWFPGHVLVASDITHNLILEARGYGAGFGRVHELPLHKVFKGIKTYKQLAQAYKAQQPLILLNAQGKNRSTLKKYTIFDLRESCRCWRVEGIPEPASASNEPDEVFAAEFPGG